MRLLLKNHLIFTLKKKSNKIESLSTLCMYPGWDWTDSCSNQSPWLLNQILALTSPLIPFSYRLVHVVSTFSMLHILTSGHIRQAEKIEASFFPGCILTSKSTIHKTIMQVLQGSNSPASLVIPCCKPCMFLTDILGQTLNEKVWNVARNYA